jgi:hypothetical protein
VGGVAWSHLTEKKKEKKKSRARTFLSFSLSLCGKRCG